MSAFSKSARVIPEKRQAMSERLFSRLTSLRVFMAHAEIA